MQGPAADLENSHGDPHRAAIRPGVTIHASAIAVAIEISRWVHSDELLQPLTKSLLLQYALPVAAEFDPDTEPKFPVIEPALRRAPAYNLLISTDFVRYCAFVTCIHTPDLAVNPCIWGW